MWIVGGGPTLHEGSAHSRVAHDHKMRPSQNGPSPRSPGGEECAPPEACVLAAGITPLASADHLIAWRIPCAPDRITLIGRYAWRNASMSLAASRGSVLCNSFASLFADSMVQNYLESLFLPRITYLGPGQKYSASSSLTMASWSEYVHALEKTGKVQ